LKIENRSVAGSIPALAPFPAKHCCSETAFAAAKAFATCRDGRLARGLRVARSNVIQDFAPPAH